MNLKTKSLITRYYDAFNAGDMDTFLTLLDEEVVHDINQGARETGKQAFLQFMERMNRNYKETIENLEIMTNEDGTRAAAEFVVIGSYLRTDEGLPSAKGQTYRLPAGAFFDVRAEKVARVTNYYNLEDWIRQVNV